MMVIAMTRSDGTCDGRNCSHEFDKGETYLYMKDEPDEIFCCAECLFSWGEPYLYGNFGDDEEGEET